MAEFNIEVVNGTLVPNSELAHEIQKLAEFQITVQEMKNEEELIKEMLSKKFGELGIEPHSVTIAGSTFSYVKPSVRKTIDSKRLKEELPDIAEEYSKETKVKAGWKVSYGN